jgi:hypothetical protein
MARLSDFKVDPVKESEGVWVELNDGLALLIAGAENPAYRKYRQKLLHPHIRELRTKQLSTDELEDLTKRAMARCILLGWRNLEEDDGTPIEYSEANSLKILRESRELFTLVSEIARDQDRFRRELNKESEKNS